MRTTTLVRSLALAAFVGALAGGAGVARAQSAGFQLNRYEPTPAAEPFFAVERPWYSSTRWFAGGLTLNYGHEPLVYGTRTADDVFTRTASVIGHQLVGHVDLAGSFLDRVQVSASLPVTLFESGDAVPAGAGISPVNGVVVGDPRVGVMVRAWNHADRDPISIHVGGHVWIPIGADANHAGDANARILPKLVLGGIVLDHLRWSATVGYLIRWESKLADKLGAAGSTAGQELQLGAGLGWAFFDDKSLHVGPELVVASITNGGHVFERAYTSIEALVGADYLIKNMIQVGAAIGAGLLKEPGTPDLRVLVRVAWAPVRPQDADGDGITDDNDACPKVKGVAIDDPRMNGCPDRDADGVSDKFDRCPETPAGPHPDPERRGCPMADRDEDGVADDQDECPDVAQGKFPDSSRLGCPNDRDSDGVIDEKDECIDVPAGKLPDAARPGCPNDRDKDGVPDAKDQCPDVPQGATPDPARRGCPSDKDADGVPDEKDQCPDVPQGTHPDPARLGCPQPDKDGDNIPDTVDACPDKPGAPDPDPKKNGCPGLVIIKNGMIQILNPVYFAPDKDVILPKSFPVLAAVGNALKLDANIKKVAIEGHTDIQGAREHNVDLSERRARSVLKYLVDIGKIEEARLEAHGYGPDKPIADNKTAAGRSQNRRVEFHITDPAPPPSAEPEATPAPAEPAKPAKKPKAE